ncbi:MAG: hypothetical protein AVDCRST_MAG42-2462, partial [uncultured Chthoniobacterales bacterium]
APAPPHGHPEPRRRRRTSRQHLASDPHGTRLRCCAATCTIAAGCRV